MPSEATPNGRPTGSNPFHPSRGPLAAILPLFPRRLQFPIPARLNLLLMPGALRRNPADGAVQTDVVVMIYGKVRRYEFWLE